VSAVNSVRPPGNGGFRSRGHVYASRPEKGEELN